MNLKYSIDTHLNYRNRAHKKEKDVIILLFNMNLLVLVYKIIINMKHNRH